MAPPFSSTANPKQTNASSRSYPRHRTGDGSRGRRQDRRAADRGSPAIRTTACSGPDLRVMVDRLDQDLTTWRCDTAALRGYLGHRNIQHTLRHTELAPGRFKDFWRDWRAKFDAIQTS